MKTVYTFYGSAPTEHLYPKEIIDAIRTTAALTEPFLIALRIGSTLDYTKLLVRFRILAKTEERKDELRSEIVSRIRGAFPGFIVHEETSQPLFLLRLQSFFQGNGGRL